MSASTTFTLAVLGTTTTSLSSSANPATSGQTVVLTATVTPAASTGTVQFFDGAASLGTAALTSGTATLSTSALSQGNHSLSAVYSGDSTHNGSTGTLSESVKSQAGLTTAASPSPAVAGQTVTFTANVAAAATGSVTFIDGATTLATVAISAGRATYTTSSLAAGIHSIGFNYAGDSNFFAASASFNETVLAASSVVLGSSANPATVGQSVTFTATVRPASVTGSVQFLDGGSVIGTGSIASGTAVFTIASLTQGAHSVTASYSGDGNDSAASSAVISQVVNPAAPSSAPSSLTASAISPTQINLGWTASSTSGVTYSVYASTSSSFTPSASNRIASGVSGITYSASGLTASIKYYFRVTAVNGGVESVASNQATATTLGITACHVSYSVTSQWNNGFDGAFSIQNTGTTALTSWSVTWTWPGNQKIKQSWNANHTQSGANVTLTNLSFNASIAPGATLSGMGFAASYQGTNSAPTVFSVNGVLCH